MGIAKQLTTALVGATAGVVGTLSTQTPQYVEPAKPKTIAYDTYRKYEDKVVKYEGSVKDWRRIEANKHDRGGITNWGITLITYNSLAFQVLGKQPTFEGFEAMTQDEARLFMRYIWQTIGGDKFDSPAMAIIAQEITWGSGYAIATRRMRLILNRHFAARIPERGAFDSTFYAAANKVDPIAFIYAAERVRMEAIAADVAANPAQGVFRLGWERRVREITQWVLINRIFEHYHNLLNQNGAI